VRGALSSRWEEKVNLPSPPHGNQWRELVREARGKGCVGKILMSGEKEGGKEKTS